MPADDVNDAPPTELSAGTRRRRPTRDEYRRRVEHVARLLGRGRLKWEIKTFLRARWGCSARASERYLAAARRLLVRRTGKSLEEHRVDAYAFWHSIIRDPAAPLVLRMEAQRHLCHLLGLFRRTS